MSLIDLRKHNNLTQQDIANILNCSQQKVSAIENNRLLLTTKDIKSLIDFFNLDANTVKLLIESQIEKD